MIERGDFRRALESDERKISFTCQCGHSVEFTDFEEMSQNHDQEILDAPFNTDNIVDALYEEDFSVECLNCGASEYEITLRHSPFPNIIFQFTTSDIHEGMPYFSPTSTISSRRTEFTNLLNSGEMGVSLKCDCGYTESHSEWGDFVHQIELSDDYVTTLGSSNDSFQLADGSFEFDCPNCTASYDTAELRETESGPVFVIISDGANVCENCGELLSEDGFKSGPDAPLIGWNYYECPSCEEKFPPDEVR